MKTVMLMVSVAILSGFISVVAYSQKKLFSWTDKDTVGETIESRIEVPNGYRLFSSSPALKTESYRLITLVRARFWCYNLLSLIKQIVNHTR